MNDAFTTYGLIGCGGFGRFCLGEYQKMETLHCVAVADHDPTLAKATAEQFGVQACASAEALLARPDIQIVHLATPPSTHAAIVSISFCDRLMSLRIGKVCDMSAPQGGISREVTLLLIAFAHGRALS